MVSKLVASDKDVIFRHEYKYEINQIQMERLKIQLQAIINVDPHAGDKQKYNIRSVYFDDYYNSCYYENENGVAPRSKFRIRIYDGSDKRISLELKHKNFDKTYKQSCRMSREDVERLLSGRNIRWADDMDPLLKKLYMLVETRCLAPKVIVDYDRMPFVYPDGNVRITFDHNIRTSSCIDTFFHKHIHARPIMPIGKSLLEVKFDEFLPDSIYRTIQSEGLYRTTFSKYFLCRKFGGIV